MAMLTVRPSATLQAGNWSRMGGTSHHGVLADQSDATYLYAKIAGHQSRCDVTFATPAVPAGLTIRSTRLRIRWQRHLSGGAAFGTEQMIVPPGDAEERYVEGIDSSVVFEGTVPIGTWAWHEYPWRTTRPKGGGWTIAKLTDLVSKIGFYNIQQPPGEGLRISQLELQVDYQEVAPTVTPAVVKTSAAGVSSSLRPTVQIGFNHPRLPQSSYRVRIYNAVGGVASGAPIYESGMQSSSASEMQIPISLSHGGEYIARVEASVSDGTETLWSSAVDTAFTVSLTPVDILVVHAFTSPNPDMQDMVLALQGNGHTVDTIFHSDLLVGGVVSDWSQYKLLIVARHTSTASWENQLLIRTFPVPVLSTWITIGVMLLGGSWITNTSLGFPEVNPVYAEHPWTQEPLPASIYETNSGLYVLTGTQTAYSALLWRIGTSSHVLFGVLHPSHPLAYSSYDRAYWAAPHFTSMSTGGKNLFLHLTAKMIEGSPALQVPTLVLNELKYGFEQLPLGSGGDLVLNTGRLELSGTLGTVTSDAGVLEDGETISVEITAHPAADLGNHLYLELIDINGDAAGFYRYHYQMHSGTGRLRRISNSGTTTYTVIGAAAKWLRIRRQGSTFIPEYSTEHNPVNWVEITGHAEPLANLAYSRFRLRLEKPAAVEGTWQVDNLNILPTLAAPANLVAGYNAAIGAVELAWNLVSDAQIYEVKRGNTQIARVAALNLTDPAGVVGSVYRVRGERVGATGQFAEVTAAEVLIPPYVHILSPQDGAEITLRNGNIITIEVDSNGTTFDYRINTQLVVGGSIEKTLEWDLSPYPDGPVVIEVTAHREGLSSAASVTVEVLTPICGRIWYKVDDVLIPVGDHTL